MIFFSTVSPQWRTSPKVQITLLCVKHTITQYCVIVNTFFVFFSKINMGSDNIKQKYIYPRIRDLREDRDLTQEDMANHLNTYLTQYRRWETGETEVPTHIIKELCIFYNVSADYILSFTNNFKSLPKK